MSDRRRPSTVERHGMNADDVFSDGLGSADSEDNIVEPTADPGLFVHRPDVSTFAIEIHRSLNPKEVVLIAVQEIRPILRCDRVSFLERRGRRFRLNAVSGHPGTPPRSRQRSLLEQLVGSVMRRGERFQFPDDKIKLPEDIERRLAAYWENANGNAILVEPVFAAKANPTLPTSRHLVGALVIEQFNDSSLSPGTLDRLDLVVPHLTQALANARRYSRLTSVPGLYHLGLLFEGIQRSRPLVMTMYLAAVAGLIYLAGMTSYPLEIECHGRLMPASRREVFAGLEGVVIDVAVNESERVEEGQILAQIRSQNLEKVILEQTGMLKSKLKARDAARADLHGRSAPLPRGQSTRDQAQLEVLNAEVETIHRQLELLEQEQEQLVIRAPIAGTITTERLREKLLGRPVQRGDTLLEIMNEAGDWQLELAVAEKKVGHLLAFQQHATETSVKFRLHSGARQSFDCKVSRIGDRSLPSAELGACSQVFCNVSQLDMPARRIGAEATARIQCGEKSLLFIWFHEFWELLQRHWWV